MLFLASRGIGMHFGYRRYVLTEADGTAFKSESR